MIINEDTQIRDMCKKIVELSTKDGILDQDECDRRLGMLFTDRCLDHVKFKEHPAKPELIQRYETLPRDKKLIFDKENPDWRNSYAVAEWMRVVSSADAENKSNVHWIKHWMTKVDDERKYKLEKKLKEFKIKNPTVTVTKYGADPDPDIQRVSELFEGNVVEGGWKHHVRKGMPKIS